MYWNMQEGVHTIHQLSFFTGIGRCFLNCIVFTASNGRVTVKDGLGMLWYYGDLDCVRLLSQNLPVRAEENNGNPQTLGRKSNPGSTKQQYINTRTVWQQCSYA
jgi:hypothetical protein